MSQDLITWNRQTYSVLDYIGDLGGLLDGLKYVCLLIALPFSNFSLSQLILTQIFRYRPRESSNKDDEADEQKNVHNDNGYVRKISFHQLIQREVSKR